GPGGDQARLADPAVRGGVAVVIGTPPDGRWAPANEVEEALQAAARAGDVRQVMGILAMAPLYLPGLEERPGAGQRLLTMDREGVPYLLVFTSVPTLHR